MLASKKDKSLATAAGQAGMSENTARKYLRSEKLPSELQKPHTWRIRKDPFKEVCTEKRIASPDRIRKSIGDM